MKKASEGELFENAVIHRCYAFWMLGVPTDHDMRYFSNATFWTDMFVRSFGFILLGAYQDARPKKEGAIIHAFLCNVFSIIVFAL